MKGPEYLWESEENWPEAEIGKGSQNDLEVWDEVQVHSIKIETPDAGLGSEAPCASDRPVHKMVTYLGSWLKLQHCIAWLVCFCHWLRNQKTSEYRSITHKAMGSHPANHEVSPGSKFC